MKANSIKLKEDRDRIWIISESCIRICIVGKKNVVGLLLEGSGELF